MISQKTINFHAYRSTNAPKIDIFRGGPVKFVATIDSSIDLTGCSLLRLDIRESSTDTDSPLASEEIVSPVGSEFSFEFSTGQTNHDLSSAWLVLSAYFPEGVGDSDDNLDPLFIAELTIVPHNASLLAPAPPNVTVLPTGVFKTIAVAGQGDVVADSVLDTLTLVAGSNTTITTNATTDTITIGSSIVSTYNVKAYGAIGDGVTNDTTAIQAAATAAGAAGELIFPAGTYVITSAITILGGVDAVSSATLLYTGSGIAVQIGNGTLIRRLRFNLPQIVYSSGTWGTETGLKIINVLESIFWIPRVQGFGVGMLVYGQGSGSVHNTFFGGHIYDNKLGIVLDGDGSGWSNENYYHGFHIDYPSSRGNEVAGTRCILIRDISPHSSNGNSFTELSVEGDTPEFHVECYGYENCFTNIRWETSISALSIYPKVKYSGVLASKNTIVGGQASQFIVITQTVSNSYDNRLITNRKYVLNTADTGGLIWGQNASLSAPIFVGFENGNNVFSKVIGDYAFTLGADRSQWKTAADAFARIYFENSTGRIRLGDGTIDPRAFISGNAAREIICAANNTEVARFVNNGSGTIGLCIGTGALSTSTTVLQVEKSVNSESLAFFRNSNTGSSAYFSLAVASNAGTAELRTHSATHTTWPAGVVLSAGSGLTGGMHFVVSETAPLDIWIASTKRATVNSSGLTITGIGSFSAGLTATTGTFSGVVSAAGVGIGATPTSTFPFRANISTNAGIFQDLVNTNTGSSALVSYQFQTDAGASAIQMRSLAYSLWPGKFVITTPSTGNGLILNTGGTSDPIEFYTDNTKRGEFNDTGFSVTGAAAFSGIITAAGLGIGATPSSAVPLRVNVSANSGVVQDIVNTNAGTSASAALNLQTDAGISTIRAQSLAYASLPGKLVIATPSTASGMSLVTAGAAKPIEFYTDSVKRAEVSDTAVICQVPVTLKGYTVATLPAGVVGMTAYVTDATTPTYLGALTGGGAVTCPVFYNGTAWISG